MAIFGPKGIILSNLVEVHYVMLHTKYQVSRPSVFYGGTFRTFIFFISENKFRGDDLICCLNGIIIRGYEIAFHAID